MIPQWNAHDGKEERLVRGCLLAESDISDGFSLKFLLTKSKKKKISVIVSTNSIMKLNIFSVQTNFKISVQTYHQNLSMCTYH